MQSGKQNEKSAPVLDPLTEDQEKIFEKKIVWIFGSPRSGTTWFGTQLLKYPTNIIWPEPYIGYHLGYFKQTWYNDRNEYFFSKYYKNSWLPYIRKLILARTYSMAQSLEKNIIIKEPNGSDAADILMESMPNSKLIFLLRDGHDVVDSLMDRHRNDSWSKQIPKSDTKPFESQKMKNDAIKKYSAMWERITNVVWETFQKHNPELRILIKYEDLIKDTLLHLKKIYHFLGVNIDDKELLTIIERYDFKNIPKDQKGPGKFNRLAIPGTWKEKYNKEEVEIMQSIMGNTLKKFEYDN